MRTATLVTITFVAMSQATTAQKFTLLPQAGVENSRTTVQYNGLPSFLPAGEVLSPYLGVRMDYTSKQGHGAFVGITTSHSVVSYNFSDLETGMKEYNASPGDMKLRFEEDTSLAPNVIYFNKSGSASNSAQSHPQAKAVRKSCGGSFVEYHCRKSLDNAMGYTKTKNKGWYMSIQPSLGISSAPSAKSAISTSEDAATIDYNYKAGDWSTAIITGAGFEFGKNKQRMFTIVINYLKGIGNLDTRTVTAIVGNKTTTATLKSAASSWNITAGIPIALTNNKTAQKQKVTETKEFHWKCGQYKSRCHRSN